MADEYVVSVVLEGNASSLETATRRGARAQTELEEQTTKANIAFLAQVARYQAMTAALNQTVGGFNKLAGAMDRLGFKEQGEIIRKFTAYLELIAGPAEIYLAYLTLSIALGQKDAATKGAQAAATNTLTTAIKANTIAMLKNPLFRIGVFLIGILTFFYKLEKEFGALGKTMDYVLDPIERFYEFLQLIENVINGTIRGVENFGGAILNLGDKMNNPRFNNLKGGGLG